MRIPPVRWKVKVGFLLNRNRKILPAALYQGHFTSRLKKVPASRGPVTPVRTVIKRTPLYLSLSFSLSLSQSFILSLSFSIFFSEMPLPVTLVPFEATTAKSISMSTFVLFSQESTAPMGYPTHASVTSQGNVRFSEHLNGAS